MTLLFNLPPITPGRKPTIQGEKKTTFQGILTLGGDIV